MEQKQYLTIGETQAFLGTSRTFIYNLISQGKLTRYYVNKRCYIRNSDLQNLFQPKQ
jgi:excisionase family DNA binding protein